MADQKALAGFCAQLTKATVKHILEAGDFARLLRGTRHEIVPLNAELLGLKTTLEILHDDLAGGEISLSSTLTDALYGILQCCEAGIEHSHRIITNLSASGLCTGIGPRGSKARQHLELLHSILDIALDLVSILTCPSQAHRSSIYSNTTSSASLNARRFLDVIRRINVEANHLEQQSGHRAAPLARHLDRLRDCARHMHHVLSKADADDASNRHRSDSMEPDDETSLLHDERAVAALLAFADTSSGGDVRSWLERVFVNESRQSLSYKPSTATLVRSETPVSQSCDGAKSCAAFYADHIAAACSERAATPTTMEKTSRGRRRNDGRPAPPPKEPSAKGSMHLSPNAAYRSSYATSIYAASTIVTESCASARDILDIHTKPDKIAVASAKRRSITPEQRTELDWRLRGLVGISPEVPAQDIENCLLDGADPNVADDEYGFLFLRAAHENSITVFRILVSYGADICKTATVCKTRGATTSPYHTVLHAAVAANQMHIAQFLVDDIKTSHLDTLDTNGESPLQIASQTPGGYEMVRFLLESGANVKQLKLCDIIKAGSVEAAERGAMIELMIAYGMKKGTVVLHNGVSRRKGLSVLGLI